MLRLLRIVSSVVGDEPSDELWMLCLKAKLELVTGASCNSMIIDIYGKDDKFVCRLDNDDALIGSYPIDDGARIHVIYSINFHVFFSILYIFSSCLSLCSD